MTTPVRLVAHSQQLVWGGTAVAMPKQHLGALHPLELPIVSVWLWRRGHSCCNANQSHSPTGTGCPISNKLVINVNAKLHVFCIFFHFFSFSLFPFLFFFFFFWGGGALMVTSALSPPPPRVWHCYRPWLDYPLSMQTVGWRWIITNNFVTVLLFFETDQKNKSYP